MKHTAVEWLRKVISVGLTYEQEVLFEGIFEQAKEMEKEQITNAFKKGYFQIDNIDNPNCYYNETFKSE